MKLFYKYYLKIFLSPFLVGLTFFFALFLAGSAIPFLRFGLKGEKGIFYTLRFLGLVLLQALPYVLPAGFLTGVLGALGKGRREGSIKASECSGIENFRIFLPYFFLSILLSFVSFFLFAYSLPYGSYEFKKITGKKSLISEGAFLNEFKDYFLSIKKVRGNTMEGITLIKYKEGKPSRIISSPYGKYQLNIRKNILLLDLFHGWIDQFDQETGESIRGKFSRYTVELHFKKKIKAPRKSPYDLTWKELEKKIQELKEKGVDAGIYLVEKKKRISLSFVPLLFLFIGYPLGKKWGGKGKWHTIGLSFPILILIYLLFALCEAVSLKGGNPSLLFLPYILLPFFSKKVVVS
ncbi:LptF/LptG family permease [Candidatus Calescamantes bacterium]|nr:LptF/LptG family permease [Candidatus Calescamantes bacterium]